MNCFGAGFASASFVLLSITTAASADAWDRLEQMELSASRVN